jgi:hypothetical protein
VLAKLLARIALGGVFTVQSLAEELGVSKELVEAMLADLERAGYLKSLDSCEGKKCRGCHSATTCTLPAKVWMVAEQE